MDYDYKKLLDRAWDNLPEKVKSHERFEMPQVVTFLEGNQTIIKNLNEIADRLGRSQEHIFTYLLKELASRGSIEASRAIIQRPLRRDIINKKIEDYANEYVLCHECKKPDTKITELEGQKIIKCDACGGWWPFRRIK